MRPFFSIISPCCDVEPYVGECLHSVIGQAFPDWECLIGIEASKDRTEEIVRTTIAGDERFRVFTRPRSGSCSSSRNIGVEMARGEYVVFLDGDDAIQDGALQRLHDRITAQPGADLYPCAIQVQNDALSRVKEIRDNYPLDAPAELTGPEATLLICRNGPPCPMLQMTVFRRKFLIDRGLRCVYGLRRQDSEFSPRALYLAKRVVPLHERFYVYRLQAASVSSSARGGGYFHGDWATILKSLFAFHALVSKEAGFDSRVAECWMRIWSQILFFLWFAPENLRKIPRARRLETLGQLFADGEDDFRSLMKCGSFLRRVAGWWVCAFVRHASLRRAAELFFRLYFWFSKVRPGRK